jgi:hypothetical protein
MRRGQVAHLEVCMTKVERALQVWQVLIAAAYNRQILTYSIVADLIGVGQEGRGAIAIRPYLGPLMRYCEARSLPPVTALIVEKATGKPGSGLRTLSSNPDRDRENVFAHKWFKEKPLSIGDLEPFANREAV